MNGAKLPDTPSVDWRVATIAFADVAGYSRLMANDSIATMTMWKQLRDHTLLPLMEHYKGRLIESPGDAVLAEFPGAVKAVNWAVNVQQSLINNITENHEDALKLRIGINVDEVIDDDGALFSDGLNIAARIHQYANPGEIVITGTAREMIANRLPFSYRDLGTPPLKNIDRPIQIFAVEASASEEQGEVVSPFRSWSSRPTLAVLPFRTLGAAEDQYFGEGITEDIVAGVSHSRTLFVIAHSSTLRFSDGQKSLREIANILGVRYLLTGSVRRHANRLRITAELIGIEHSHTVWTEQYNGTSDDLFEFQDRMVANIVAALEPQVMAAETKRIGNRPTQSLDAYDCVLRALSLLYEFTPESHAESFSLLRRAIALDPKYAQAHAYLAWCLNFWIAEGHTRKAEADLSEAINEARLAVELDPQDAICLSIAGHVLALLERNPEGAVDLFKQALERDENSPLAWGLSALTYAYLGKGDETRDRLNNLWRLAPYDPHSFFFWATAGLGEFVAGRYEEAIVWFRKSYRVKPRLVATLRMLSATLALSGNLEEAKRIGEELLMAEPGFRISEFVSWYPLRRAEDKEKITRGLTLAGLPE